MKRPGKILIHVTCKAYSTGNADRLPKYNQHRVITDGHSVIRIIESSRWRTGKNRLNARVAETRCRENTDKSFQKGA